MYTGQPPRALAAASSAALTALVFAVLVFGLGVAKSAPVMTALVSVALSEPPPPPPRPKERPVARHASKPAPKKEAGQRNLRNEATPIVAPPVVPLKPPPPVVVAPIANVGAAAQTGASDRRGPGQGAGDHGNGLGGGGTGGDGNGSGDGVAEVGPRQIGGRMSFRDLPEDALPIGEQAAVGVVFAVEKDGRAAECRIDRPSGRPAIDSLTCRLIEQRFRFRPALDRYGRPVRSLVGEMHTWYARPE